MVANDGLIDYRYNLFIRFTNPRFDLVERLRKINTIHPHP